MSGYGSTDVPIVTAKLMQSTGAIQSVVLEATTGFADASADWKVAEFKVPNASLTHAKNVYSVSINISQDDVSQDFEINDISLIIRPKSVK